MPVWDVAARPGREQFGYWHEVICRAFVPLTPQRTESQVDFAARVETRPLCDVVRAQIFSQPQRTIHGRGEVARTDGAFYFVNAQLAGRCRTRQGRVESVVGPGEFTIVDTTEPFDFDFDAPWQMASFRLPRELLDVRLGGVRPGLGERFDGGGAGGVVLSMLTSLWDIDESVDTAAGAELEHALASAVAAATAGRPGIETQPRAVLRAEILRHVRRRLGDRSLSVSSVCRRFAIAPRTLHAAFADGDHSFAAVVRRLRLERCATLLADPARVGSITELAASVGFDDAASFSRAFRREFGCTPSEVRRYGLTAVDGARNAQPSCTQ